MKHVSVKVSASAYADELVERRVIQRYMGTILGHDFKRTTQLGEIIGFRFLGSIDEVVYWADLLSQEVCDASEWLMNFSDPDEIELALSEGCLYIQSVVVKPRWRGRINTLKAVATYIELVANERFVFFQPYPLNSKECSNSVARQVVRLRMFWEKLGMEHYDSAANMLWSPYWTCPEWLAGS